MCKAGKERQMRLFSKKTPWNALKSEGLQYKKMPPNYISVKPNPKLDYFPYHVTKNKYRKTVDTH